MQPLAELVHAVAPIVIAWLVTRRRRAVTPTFARKSHGNARKGGRLAVVESKPWAEQLEAANAAPPIARDGLGRVRAGEDAARLAKLPRASRGLPASARAYRSARILELEAAHGTLSKGVGAMVDAEACAWAAGATAARRAEKTGEPRDIAAMTSAFETARALAKDAWSLAAFEARGRVGAKGNTKSMKQAAEALGQEVRT